MVTMPSSSFFSSTMTMFWFGPWICWATTWSLLFSLNTLATVSP